ncbi:MAG: hypothetical protein HYW07_10300 [Candidatus Latescibacteria bacterium]|nr:hypothetical protein [Candidatus Latescibacterota bacterium]
MLTTTEQRELQLHRTHLFMRAKLDGLKARLTALEADPIPTPAQRRAAQEAQQQARVDEFWRLTTEEQEKYQLSAAEARKQVLRKHPEFKAVYPRIKN